MLHNAKLEVLKKAVDNNGLFSVLKYRTTYSSRCTMGKDEEAQELRNKMKEEKLARMFAAGKTLEEIEAERSNYNTERKKYVRVDSLKRAKDKIYNLIVMNDFKYFLTITIDINSLNTQGFDSTDKTLVMKKVGKWLNNQSNRKGLKYLLIPEYHKDKKKIHCHSLINEAFELTDSGRRLFKGKSVKISTLKRKKIDPRSCKTVFNVPEWKYGFSTAIELDNSTEKIARYVLKYITKGNNKIFGKYYWSSQSLKRSADVIYFDCDYERITSPEFYCKPSDTGYKYRTNVFVPEDELQGYEETLRERDRAPYIKMGMNAIGSFIEQISTGFSDLLTMSELRKQQLLESLEEKNRQNRERLELQRKEEERKQKRDCQQQWLAMQPRFA